MPSSSFSYSSSSNVDTPSCRSKNGRNSGCISTILRRILCFNSLPSSPFDHLKEGEKETLLESVSGTPGIVARLMGLDTLPRAESIDGLAEDSCRRSSRSSRRSKIIPTYKELEDENFFILSFEHEGERKQKNKCKKKKMKKESLHENDDKENVEVNKVVKVSDLKVSPLKNCNKKCEKMRKKKVKEDRLALISSEMGGDSENSSPNSVLDFVEFPAAVETASPGDISRLANSKLRRTLCEELENCRKSKERKLINEEEKHSRLRFSHQNYTENWDLILKLAAREMVGSSWVDDEISKNHVYFTEIGRDIASEILDKLINELLINLG